MNKNQDDTNLQEVNESNINLENQPKTAVVKEETIEIPVDIKDDKIIEEDNIVIPKGVKKQKKAISRIMLLFMAFIIGLLLIIQLNTAEKITGGLSTSQRALQLQTELKNLIIKRENKEAELKNLEEKIQELTMSESSPEEIGKQIKNEIEKYDIIIGNTNAKGPGIKLTMMDKDKGSLLVNNYELILAVINKLNAAGAEAIAVNGIRWSSNTYLNLNKGLLYVDESPIEAPIVIEAIGDMNTLEASLNLRFGILHDLRNNYEIECNIEKVDEIILPKLINNISFEYGKPEVK